MKVKVDNLGTAIELELDAYSEEVREDLRKAVKDASALCLRLVKQKSPRRTGDYAKGWARQLSKPPDDPAAVIYNKKFGFMAHLAEFGHAKAGGGRVEGTAHIQPAADAAEHLLLQKVTELLGG